MARIAYGVAGEGRGHATRSKAIARMLEARGHEVRFFTSAQGYDFLARSFPAVERIPRFGYFYRDGRLSYRETIARNLATIIRGPGILARIARRISSFAPHLAITDFEPFTARAAAALGIPFLSIDHSHFVLCFDVQAPPRFWRDDLLSRLLVKYYYRGQAETVVSSFFAPRLRPGIRARAVGPIIRDEIRHLDPRRRGHILVYVRRAGIARVAEVLRETPGRYRFYGDAPAAREGRIEFCGIDEEGFARDLASAEAVITTAGNQLVGEALFLGKPVLAIPEANTYEQYLNGHFLARSGCGESVAFEDLSPARVQAFLARIDAYAARIRRQDYSGNDAVLGIIERHLAVVGDQGRSIRGAVSRRGRMGS
ncbi:MAG: glycosyltransferase [Planctomycetes bacterium]|nr:glycosyltransferase [Planctomycetota bacterium]